MRIGYVLAFLPALALATGKPQQPAKPAAPSSAAASQQQAQDQRQTATSAAEQSQTATGGAAAANQVQTANGGTASNAGNQQVSSYDNPRQTASAFAPSIAPSAVCSTARSGGISTSVVGIAGGTSGTDIQCDIRETARLFGELGYRDTAALIACTSSAAVRAFNGRPCPVPEARESRDLTIRIEDVGSQRAVTHGFTPPTK